MWRLRGPSRQRGRAASWSASPRATRDRDSRHPKEKSKNPSTTRYGQRALLAVLFLCGPIGTVVSFWLLPKGGDGAEAMARHSAMRGGASGNSATGPRVRMVHLSLAGSDRRARFVLDENTVWEAFLAGCRERLQVAHIHKVTDSNGEAILAVEVCA